MSTIEIKDKIFKKLDSVDDALLNDVLALLEFESDTSEYILSDAQKAAIDESRTQIKKGEFLTNKEVNKEIDEWLNK
jgi:predicted transcriptional regulator